MTTPLPSGYCAGSRFLDLDITNLNFSNTVPAEHSDKNNFVHFAGEKEIVPTACIYLIHGLHGTEKDFDNFVKILKKEPPYDDGQDPKEKSAKLLELPPTIILRSISNRGMLPTMQGVEECALNALQEIRQCLEQWESIKYLTVLGHSFGGVIARNMVEKLSKDTFFEDIALVDLFLVASPTLGVRRPQNRLVSAPFNATFHFGANIVAGKTGTELLLNDEKTILHEMTKEKYVNVYAKFSRRLMYGNIFNDIQVPYTTALASKTHNPFKLNNAKKVILSDGKESKYRNIVTGWSEEGVVDMAATQFEIPPDQCGLNFQHDARKEKLKAMVANMHKVEWIKYPVLLNYLAHQQIIYKSNLINAGKTTAAHICNEIVVGLLKKTLEKSGE